MKNTNEERVFELNLRNPFTKKGVVKFLAGLSVIGITTVGTYVFADNYTLNFRTPIILQNPVVINERIPVIEIQQEEVKQEPTAATESAQVQKPEPTNMDKLLDHVNQRPDIYAMIVKVFGNESMLAGELIARESSFDPEAINPSSGACGLAQALPCKKMPCEVSDEDAECQLVWMKEYIEARYGNVEKALAFHDSKGWY